MRKEVERVFIGKSDSPLNSVCATTAAACRLRRSCYRGFSEHECNHTLNRLKFINGTATVGRHSPMIRRRDFTRYPRRVPDTATAG